MRFVKYCASMLALILACAPAALAQTTPQPNVVLIFTDDQQFNALGANGNGIIQTPTMDAIAASGVRFTQAFAALPVCSPSRAAILTGQYNQTNGVENLGNSINASSPRLGVLMQNAGYATGVTGKWHLGNALDQSALGFDYYATYNSNGSYYRNYQDISDPNAPAKPSSQHIDAYAADRSSDFIDQSLSADQPFFLWHNTQTPHLNGGLVWDALPQNLAKYDAADFYDPGNSVNNLPGNWDDDLTNKPEYYQTIRNRDLAQTDSRYLYGDPNELADHTSEYYAVITELDDMLTPLMDKLNTTPDPRNPGHNLVDNTYVIFMSDNGWLMGDHGMTSKSLPFDQAARVPMIVMGPGVDEGRSDDRQVSNVDVAPTILELAGAAVPSAMQGMSLASLLSDGGAGTGVRDTNIVEIWESTFAGNKPILAGYDGRYEVFYTYDSENAALPSYVEVYDLQQDPWELNNLAGDLANNAGAYAAWQSIHTDIQAHRVNNIGTFSHATHTVASGVTLNINDQLPAPDGLADQTIPQVIAADVIVDSGGAVQGGGIILGGLTATTGSTISIGAGPGTGTTTPHFASADFSDLTSGPIATQAGGDGWGGTWGSVNAGSGGDIDVVTGDLSPHSSTNYAVGQDAPARRLQRNASGASTAPRTLATDMDGEIWFSFLAKVDSDGRSGINIDGTSGFSDNRFLMRAQGGTALDFFVQGTPNNLEDFTPDIAGLTDTQLIVGKLTVNPGDDLLQWWVNPDVVLGVAGLDASADQMYQLNDRDFDEDDGTPGIQTWSVHLYSGGELDNLIISNGPDAYFDVTGQPAGSAAEMSFSVLEVVGDYQQSPGATLAVDLQAAGPGGSDLLIIGGQASLGGALELSHDDRFEALIGETITLIEAGSIAGVFDTVTGQQLHDGRRLAIQYTPTQVLARVVTPADLDADGDVDDADFGLAFAAFTGPNNGPSSNPDADLDGDGDVDDADFGLAFAAFTGPGGPANVPEPTSLAILAAGLAVLARRKEHL